mgnify:CR=1 FL=1
MKILIVSTGIQNRAGTYIVLKNIIPFLMKNNEITILTNIEDNSKAEDDIKEENKSEESGGGEKKEIKITL